MQYVSFDVDGIREYVFSAYRPSLVQGASELIKSALDCVENEEGEAIKELKNTFRDIEVIYSCGGTGLLKVKESNGEKVCKELEKIYAQMVPGSTLTAVWEKADNDFQTLLKKLSLKLRIEKNRKAINEKGNTMDGNFKNRCSTCGRGNITNKIFIGGEEEHVCESCNKKYMKVKDERYPTSIEDIPYDKERNPHITLIYCDLNNAGRILFECKDENELRQKSETIYNINLKIIKNIKSDTRDKSGLHLITPVIGGDDLIFLLPAEKTFNVIDIIIFEEEVLKNLGLSFSISFVVSHYHTSIYHLFTVASESLKRAKEIYYKEPTTSGVDFVWLREGIPFKEEAGNFFLTAKPYKREDFIKIKEIAVNMLEEEIPPSYLYNLLEIVESEENENFKKINLFYYVHRSEDDKFLKIIKESLRSERVGLEDVYKFFIPERGWRLYSRFSDIMEIYKILKLRSEK